MRDRGADGALLRRAVYPGAVAARETKLAELAGTLRFSPPMGNPDEVAADRRRILQRPRPSFETT
jgi:hypothetical protein